MGTNGDDKDATKPTAADSAAAAEIAAAEAAVAEAEAKAAAARAKAELLAKQAELAKAKAGEPPAVPVALSEPAMTDNETTTQLSEAPAAPAANAPKASVRAPAPAAAAAAEDEGVVDIKPSEAGIFDHDAVDESVGAAFEPEKPFLKGAGRSKPWIYTLAAAMVLIAAGVVYLIADDYANARMDYFFRGSSCPPPSGKLNCLEWWVTKEKREKEAAASKIAFRSRPIYGNAELKYFPQDLKLDVYQAKYKKDGKAWQREEAGLGEMVCDAEYVATPPEKIMNAQLKTKQRCEKRLANSTDTLEENQFITMLPVKNLPIFLADKGNDKTDTDTYGRVLAAWNYEYRLVFHREGYKPREVIWREADWNRAPGNYFMQWNGLDLQPDPEQYRANFVKVKTDLVCLLRLKDYASPDQLKEETKEALYNRAGFKTFADYQVAETTLTKGEYKDWWATTEQEILKAECKAEDYEWAGVKKTP